MRTALLVVVLLCTGWLIPAGCIAYYRLVQFSLRDVWARLWRKP